jgi:hypothetical protein
MTIQFKPGRVVAARLYPSGDMQLIRVTKSVNIAPDRTDKKLRWLSAKSRTRLLFLLRNTNVSFRSMFCLSYPSKFPTDGQSVKRDLNRWLTWFRRRVKGVPYFWFLEFQARGAPHVHIYLAAKAAELPHAEMASAWAGFVSGDSLNEHKKVLAVHSHKKQLQDFRARDGYIRYAAKYALKTHQKAVPMAYQNVGRFWGASRVVKDSVPEGDLVPLEDRDIEEHLYKTGHRAAQWDVIPKIIFGAFEPEI